MPTDQPTLTELNSIPVAKIEKRQVSGPLTDLLFFGKGKSNEFVLIDTFHYNTDEAATIYANKYGAKFDKNGVCVF